MRRHNQYFKAHTSLLFSFHPKRIKLLNPNLSLLQASFHSGYGHWIIFQTRNSVGVSMCRLAKSKVIGCCITKWRKETSLPGKLVRANRLCRPFDTKIFYINLCACVALECAQLVSSKGSYWFSLVRCFAIAFNVINPLLRFQRNNDDIKFPNTHKAAQRWVSLNEQVIVTVVFVALAAVNPMCIHLEHSSKTTP